MEEVLDAAFVPNEPEPLVDQQPCNRATRHDWSFASEAEPRNACESAGSGAQSRHGGCAKSRRRRTPTAVARAVVGSFVAIGVVLFRRLVVFEDREVIAFRVREHRAPAHARNGGLRL